MLSLNDLRLDLIPPGTDDEGLDPVEVDVSVADIYCFFEAHVQAREARRVLEQQGNG